MEDAGVKTGFIWLMTEASVRLSYTHQWTTKIQQFSVRQHQFLLGECAATLMPPSNTTTSYIMEEHKDKMKR